MQGMNTLQSAAPSRAAPPLLHSCPPARRATTIGAEPRLQVVWARHEDDLRQALQLRQRVFAESLGATCLTAPTGMPPGLDADRFDDHGEHLLLRTPASDTAPARLVASCRVLTPAGARRAGGLQGETLFDLSRLAALRPRIVELGRWCIDPAWRGGGVMALLGAALADFMLRNDLDIGFGCARLPLHDSGRQAANLWRRLQRGHAASERLAAIPRLALTIDALHGALHDDKATTPPALLQALLQCGGKLLGPPAWDASASSAALPMMMQLAYLPAAYRQRFLAH